MVSLQFVGSVVTSTSSNDVAAGSVDATGLGDASLFIISVVGVKVVVVVVVVVRSAQQAELGPSVATIPTSREIKRQLNMVMAAEAG